MLRALTKKEYQENFAGFAIKSMTYRSRNKVFSCVLVEDLDLSDDSLSIDKRLAREGDLNYRFVNFMLDPEHATGYMEIDGGNINRALMIGSQEADEISVDFNGMVWESKVEGFDKWPGYRLEQTDPTKTDTKKSKGPMLNAPAGDNTFPKGRLRYIKELKVIDDVVYACGGVRKVLRRDAYDKWTDLTLMTAHPQLQKEYLEAKTENEKAPIVGSFNSVDGFSANDLYSCGNNGDFWHYDGKDWTKIHMPNIELNKVVCANDGAVYVAARDGKVFKGRKAHDDIKEVWKLIESESKGLLGNPFEGATWFKGKLYLCTSYGLYVLDKEENICAVDFGKKVQHSFQNVTSNNDFLISYGPYNALVFDGQIWTTIVSSLLEPSQ